MIEESKKISKYFEDIRAQVVSSYNFASQAKSKNLDMDEKVDIFLAENLFERVVGLIKVIAPQLDGEKIISRLIELEKEYGSQDWRVAFRISYDIAMQNYCDFSDKVEAMEVALRFGLAYITVGVVASPLEGFVKLKLKKRRGDDREYFSLFFSGPIRSAGTTATCVFVALADYIRTKMGYAEYDPDVNEINRVITELYDFHEKITNLQYLPSEEELSFFIKNLPVEIEGDPSEDIEVSNYKDLQRVETNRLRNGVCLVWGESLTQKGAKFNSKFIKWRSDFEMEHWKFLDGFVKLQKEIRSKGKLKEEKNVKIVADYNYLKDLVAGRPILGYPMEVGSFRLRYGRCRNSGFSSCAIHPATMFILKNYIAIGTQLKMERPGKATTLASCDSIEGPIVKLQNGNVVLVDDEETAKKIVKNIEEILFLGDILISYGDFLNRAHILAPPGYCEEWWVKNVERELVLKGVSLSSLGVEGDILNCSAEQSIILSNKLNVPLHPKYTYHWGDINKNQFLSLIGWLEEAVISKDKIILPFSYNVELDIKRIEPKRVLELLGIPHLLVNKESVVIEKDFAKGFAASLGFYSDELNEKRIRDIANKFNNVLEIINAISEVKIKDKSGLYIGARMGRPEKAKIRKLTGSPNGLFPVGEEGGRLRSVQCAMEKGSVNAQFSLYYCNNCNKDTIYRLCEVCGNESEKRYYCPICREIISKSVCSEHGETLNYKNINIDINHYYKEAVKKLKLKNYPSLVKGIRGTSNKDHLPENLIKGILRGVYGLTVNKDGTIRYDMTEMGITHFKPKEVGTSVNKLKSLGYMCDIYGCELISDDQIVEIFPQDVILPSCSEAIEERCDEILFRVSQFIDDLLIKYYGAKPYYSLKNKKELVGHLVIAISPHTSAGIVGRIIGFSDTQGFLASPVFHSIMRRDLDGDECGVMLLMDAFLNFSRKLLGAHRGAKQDEPLVLTSKLIPAEVDDMVFDMDICWEYPLEFYEAAERYTMPLEVNILKLKDRLNTEGQYEGYGFTHNTSDLNNGVKCSAYKFIPSMKEKVEGQMMLAEQIRAVDEGDIARLVIDKHFMKDIRGNLRKFSMQQFRCVKCNGKYRRPPLAGVCTKCGGKIIFTVTEGGIVKYLEPCITLAEKYDLPAYLKQTIELTKQRIESIFGKDKEKQEGLVKWFA